MGRYYKSGLGGGIGINSQESLEQETYQKLIERLARDLMLKPLYEMGVKFTPENVVFVVKDQTGQVLWLEDNVDNRGLKHIISRHNNDFKNIYGVDVSKNPSFLKKVIEKGKLIENSEYKLNGKDGYKKVYSYKKNKYVVFGVGKNGFIVTAYPTED